MTFALLIFQAAETGGGETALWTQLAQFGPTVVLLFLILGFLLRAAPVYKEIKLKEIDARIEENDVKREQANALGQLAGALSGLAGVVQSVAVEQRRATDTIGILQRASTKDTDELSSAVRQLTQRIDGIEKAA